MSSERRSEDEVLLEGALKAADRTRLVRVQRGVRHETATAYQELFGNPPGRLGSRPEQPLKRLDATYSTVSTRAGHEICEPLVFDNPDLHAEYPPRGENPAIPGGPRRNPGSGSVRGRSTT